MRRSPRAWAHRFVGAVAVVASLLVLGEAPLTHAVLGTPPSAHDPTVPAEEEQRTEAVAGRGHHRVVARTANHGRFAPLVSWSVVGRSSFVVRTSSLHPRTFAGAPLPLRC